MNRILKEHIDRYVIKHNINNQNCNNFFKEIRDIFNVEYLDLFDYFFKNIVDNNSISIRYVDYDNFSNFYFNKRNKMPPFFLNKFFSDLYNGIYDNCDLYVYSIDDVGSMINNGSINTIQIIKFYYIKK